MTEIMLSWGEVISALGLFMTVVSVLTGALFALYKQIRTTKTDLDEFKLQVAKEYVGTERLSVMQQELIRSEERTLSAINNLAERLDRFLTQQKSG